MFIGLVILALGAAVAYGADRAIDTVLQADTRSVEQVTDPTPEVAVPEPVNDEAAEAVTGDEEEAAEAEVVDLESDLAIKDEEAIEDEAAPIAPGDPTMYMSIPKLGLSNVTVLDDVSEEGGLMAGAGHLPGTGFPWIPGANTYIAGHRIGFPGTGSDRIFYNLPLLSSGDEIFLQDTLGRVYRYRVSKVFAVSPRDVWVMDPVAGKDVVSLQTCTETPDDWWTVGPRLMSSGPDSGRLIAQAERA